MKSWIEYLAAAIGVSIIAGAHVWFFSSERHSAGVTFQRELENRMWKMPCKTHPRGMDGIPCDPLNQLYRPSADASSDER